MSSDNYSNLEIKGDILIVDDTPANLRVLSATLGDRGYEVRCVNSGAMALTVARNAPPDLILLDIKMPEMDGYQVCQQLKSDPKTYEIPVIFLSALDDIADKVKAFTAGGVDYITKPFQTEEVLARVKNQLTISHLRQKLTAQNDELMRSNLELEQFASVVSHDLQQPLQVIVGFARMLEKKSQNWQSEDTKKFLGHILVSGTHMQELIRDLLAYSRVNTSDPAYEPVDCNEVLSQVLNNLQMANARSNAVVDYPPLPTVMANESQLEQVFQNLISNALKFQRPNTTPRVEISVTQEDEWQFSFKDNGIGIEPEKFPSIFQMFKRLHKRQEYPGTGIGLAICQKVIDAHGGRIWVESEPGIGTVFHFTLPVKDENN
ncbi:MAG: ATP-binding protein [Cyanobacteria bacterium J06648_1]